jgi:hypothetical protein
LTPREFRLNIKCMTSSLDFVKFRGGRTRRKKMKSISKMMACLMGLG